MKTSIAVAALALVITGCDKKTEAPAAPATPPAAAKAPAPAAPALTITEGKLQAFLDYRKEMLPYQKLALGIAMGAAVKANAEGKQVKDVVDTRDEQLKKYNELHEAALKKTGLTAEEFQGFTLAISPLATKAMMAKEAEAKNAELDAKKSDKPGLGEEISRKMNAEAVDRYAKAKSEFESKYGKDALEAFQKKEAEFVGLQKQELDAAMEAMKPAK